MVFFTITDSRWLLCPDTLWPCPKAAGTSPKLFSYAVHASQYGFASLTVGNHGTFHSSAGASVGTVLILTWPVAAHNNKYCLAAFAPRTRRAIRGLTHVSRPRGTTALAGLVGFEPTNAGVKVPCLTAWLQPHVEAMVSQNDSRRLSAFTWACIRTSPKSTALDTYLGYSLLTGTWTYWPDFVGLPFAPVRCQLWHLVEIVGFEPATSCLQGRRSPN